MEATQRLFLASALMLCFMPFGNLALGNESATQLPDTVIETGDTGCDAEFGIETDVNNKEIRSDAYMFSSDAEDGGIRSGMVPRRLR